MCTVVRDVESSHQSDIAESDQSAAVILLTDSTDH